MDNGDRQTAPYGSWASPLTASAIAEGSTRFGQLATHGGAVYWSELRPTEKGRGTLVCARPGEAPRDVLPKGFGARSLINSYGGGEFWLSDGQIFFVNYDPENAPPPYDAHRDQRIFSLDLSAEGDAPAQPEALTATPGSTYADGVVDRARGRIIAVREDGTYHRNGQPLQSLVSIPLEGGGGQEILVDGADFYVCPRLSPDGRSLAYLCWRYPAMSWDSAELHVAELDAAGRVVASRHVAGGEGEAACEPRWAPDGTLYFVGDRTNWWNIYRVTPEGVEAVCPRAAEFCNALWNPNPSHYDFLDSGAVVAAYREGGIWHLGRVDLKTGQLTPFELPFTEIDQVRVGEGGAAYFLGGASDRPKGVVRLDSETGRFEVLKVNTDLDIDGIRAYISHPTPITFPTHDGATSRAFYYPPTNPKFRAPEGELPPLMIMSHGGPTASAGTHLGLQIQYFTSRGFAVVNVDYRGSTGYGRDYRLSLYGNWGIYDIRDCEDAGRYLVAQGTVDGDRIVARGGSAGGYITLGLMAFTDLCRAGASYYGISSLEMIVRHSDKLEAFYPFKLIGPYPEEAEAYRARSPFYFAHDVKAPVIFFQGLEDPIVPPEQTQVMADSLRQRGIPVAVRYYEGEQHGFRRASSVEDSLLKELSFYAQVLGFEPADKMKPVEIDNWGGAVSLES